LIIQVPELIRKYIEEKGITQKEFAKTTGINEAALSRMINSRSQQIDIRTLEKLYGHIPLDFGNLVLVDPDGTQPKRRNSKG
jgi:transcriptional regulator with XRE-family HTH domain